jgi:hypothetical protein
MTLPTPHAPAPWIGGAALAVCFSVVGLPAPSLGQPAPVL